MIDPKALIDEAAAAERLAQVVSYRPDKERLLRRAMELRRQAQEAERHRPRVAP